MTETTAPASSPEMEGSEPEIAPMVALVFPLVCIFIGSLSRFLLPTWLPYTAVLLVWGLCIGFLQLIPPATVVFTETLELWLGMNPNLLLLIFLPTIGFSAAIAQEPHMLRRNWAQILILAWPGVVLQFAAIGLCAKVFFPYGWSWNQSFLFGAMLSATDPVAVVAVLQEVGASQKLANVIDGESLVNDGSALVIFLLLQRVVEGAVPTAAGVVVLFCQLALGGIGMGIAFGLVTSWWLSRVFYDPTLSTVITLLSAYGSYFCANELAGASGLLCVVTNGFTCSLAGGRHVAQRMEAAMHSFWGVMEWVANSILFIWMGVVLAFVFVTPPLIGVSDHAAYLQPSDAGWVVVLYLWLQLSRALLIALCYVPFKWIGYPMTWRMGLVFTWAGLRGAVGMVMAFFILLDTAIHDKAFQAYCIFFMGTMAFATVIINGASTKWLLQRLGFMSHTREELGVLEHVAQDLRSIREDELAGLEPDDLLGDPDWDAVRAWTRLDTAQLLEGVRASVVEAPVAKELRRAANASRKAGVAAGPAASGTSLAHAKRLYDYRLRLLRMVKALYAELFAQHQIEVGMVTTLHEAADAAMDDAATGLTDWRRLAPEIQPPFWSKWAQKVSAQRRRGVISAAADAVGYHHLLLVLGAVSAFVAAHTHAQELLRGHLDALLQKAQEEEDASQHGGGTAPAAPLERQSSTRLMMRPIARDSAALDRGSTTLARNGTALGRGSAALDRTAASAADGSNAASGAGAAGAAPLPEPPPLAGKSAAALVPAQTVAEGAAEARSGAAAVQQVLRESEEQVAAAKGMAAQLAVPHPSLPSWLRTRLVAAQVLSKQNAYVEQLSEAGLVEPREVAALQASVMAAYQRVAQAESALAAALNFAGERAVPQDLPLFDHLSEAAARQLLKHSKWRLFAAGRAIGQEGGAVETVTVLLKGTVLLRFAPVPEVCGDHLVIASTGDPLGLAELMLGCVQQAHMTTDTVVHALVVPTAVMLQLVRENPCVERRAWQSTAAQLAAQHHHILGVHRQLVPLNMHFRACDVVHSKEGEHVTVWHTALLIVGSVTATTAADSTLLAAGGAKGAAPEASFVALAAPATLAGPCQLSDGTYVCVSAQGATLLVVPQHLPPQPTTTLVLPLPRGSSDVEGGDGGAAGNPFHRTSLLVHPRHSMERVAEEGEMRQGGDGQRRRGGTQSSEGGGMLGGFLRRGRTSFNYTATITAAVRRRSLDPPGSNTAAAGGVRL